MIGYMVGGFPCQIPTFLRVQAWVILKSVLLRQKSCHRFAAKYITTIFGLHFRHRAKVNSLVLIGSIV